MIPVFRPSYDQREVDALKDVLLSGWIGLGPKTREFEERFAEYIGVKYAVAMNSATAGLHLALAAMGIEDREVITTPMTFVSTNHAILYNKGIPVFCDIEPDTLNIDAKKIEALITPKTKGIIAVHFGGYSCDLDAIQKIADQYGLFVLEDVAHGCGGEFNHKKLGSIGDIGVFSFHAVKNLATGDGGMVTTDDPKVFELLKKTRWVGISQDTWKRNDQGQNYSWYYDVEMLGYKYHMNDINATLGLVQLSKLEAMNARRAQISNAYSRLLANISSLRTPTQKPYQTKPAYHNYVVKTPLRNELNAFLKENGISTGVHYIPNNHYQMYSTFRGPTPIAEKVWNDLLTLPCYPDLKDAEVDLVVSKIKDFFDRQSNLVANVG